MYGAETMAQIHKRQRTEHVWAEHRSILESGGEKPSRELYKHCSGKIHY